MNGSEYGQQRPRPLPNGSPMSAAPRPAYDNRNGHIASPIPTANGGGPPVSRAEKFEDEKRRLIESCFSKKEADGSLSESYITHIRIEEDAAYPSAPPPGSSLPDNKKPRVIVVGVRKSGRVRMHKARENVNGTFSVGKTWVLDDLTSIESFTNAVPTTAEEQQNKQRAGTVGFIVTVQKPYYWQAASPKEKDFFIFSLIKIFRKYTGGRLPELRGFSSAEVEQLGGPLGSSSSNQGPGASSAPPTRNVNHEVPPLRDQRLPSLTPDPSREQRQRPAQERAYPDKGFYGPPGQEPTRPLHSAASLDRPLRSAASNDRMYIPGSFPSTDSVNVLNAPPQLRKKRSESPGSLSTISQASNYNHRRREPQPQPQLQPQLQPHLQPQPQPQESLRNGHDDQQSEKKLGARPSYEHVRQNATIPTSLRAGSAEPTPERSMDRPTTAIKDNEHDMSHRQEEDAAQKPPMLSSRSYQKASVSDSRISTKDGRGASSTRRTNDQKMDETLSTNPSESSADHAGEDTRPTTASSNGGVVENIGDRDKAPKTRMERDDVAMSENLASSTTETTSMPLVPPETVEEERFRPGLGPMIKKKSTKEIASTFRKAAAAANAFKPRPGGAGDKLQKDQTSGGDGITGVFQAPSLLRGVSQDDSAPTTPLENVTQRPLTPQKLRDVPSVQITASPEKTLTPIPDEVKPSQQLPEPEVYATERPQEDRRKKRRSDPAVKYAKVLGIHPSLLEGRTFEIEDALNDAGWTAPGSDKMTFEELQSALRKDLSYVEAGSWLSAVENNDERVAAVGELMDKVIAECDELDCLLTLYNVELGTLSADVAYIEAQSQGLQVQTANQKLLYAELKNLLDTISISPADLKTLKDAPLTKARGIQDIEHVLAQLYAAMLTIDPRMASDMARPMTASQNGLHRNSGTGFGGSELSSMVAVREKRDGFQKDSIGFIQRFKQYMSVKFRENEVETMEALERRRTAKNSPDSTALDPHLRKESRKALWLYSPLILFVREVEPGEWDELMRMYENCAKKTYQDEFRDSVFAWKRITKKAAGDESDVLFTSQEKESDSLVGRKLTVKRAKTVRSDGSSRAPGERLNDGKITTYEAFAGALTETAKIIFVEQNFIVDLFHASSIDSQDFIDAITIGAEERQGGDPLLKKPFDPDRDMARKVLGVMEEIFTHWSTDIQNLVDWAMKQDPLNSVGLLFALESQMSEVEETNQEFLSQAVSKVHDRLTLHFTRFVEEQVRGIEDTKVKIKKRKGVIAFVKTFPNFSTAIENMLPPVRSLEHLAIRGMVNDAYQSLNKAMFESLKFIAKESPTAIGAAAISSGDPEDKEALNHHILLIENMNHYIEEVPLRNNPVLEDWNFRARAEMSEHMDQYLSAVIRRPLGKLLDFLESTEALVKNLSSSETPASIATRASHSRSVFKKILGSYDAKEVRRGAETLKKRVEKHFGEGDETPGLSRDLIANVLKECEARYADMMARVDRLIRDVYEGSLEMDWRLEDVSAGFRR